MVKADCVAVDEEKVEDIPQVMMEDSQKPSSNVTGKTRPPRNEGFKITLPVEECSKFLLTENSTLQP